MNLAILRLVDLIGQSKLGKNAEAALQARIGVLNKETTDKERAAMLAEAEARQARDPKAGAELHQTAARARREADFRKNEAGIEVEALRRNLVESVMAQIQPLVAAITKERGLSLVLLYPNPGVAFYSPDCDITDEVLRRLDEKSPGDEPKRTDAKKPHGKAHGGR